MDRPAQLVYEGSRTLLEFDVTIEIVVIHLYKYGVFEVLVREESSQCDLRPIYLRACIIEQRVKLADIDLEITSSRSKYDPNKSLSDSELFDLVTRVSIFGYIADRLSLKRKMASFSGMYYEVFYSPDWSDPEFGPDKSRLEQLVCSDPYYFGPPAPCKDIVPEPACPKVKQLEQQDDSASPSKPATAPAKLGSVLRRLSSFFAPLSSSASERSLQTESAITVSGSLSQASADGRGDEDSVHSGTSTQYFTQRIFNRLTKLPDITEGPSYGEHLNPTTSLASPEPSQSTTPNPHISHSTLHQESLQDGTLFERRCDVELKERIAQRQQTLCSQSLPTFSSPFDESDFYDDVAIEDLRLKPAPTDIPRLRLDNEIATGQILGGALNRSARVGIA